MRAPEAAAHAAMETFPELSASGVVRHGFVGRIPGIDVATDRNAALARLEVAHRAIRAELGLGTQPFVTVEQVHGREVAVLDAPLARDQCFGGADGLVTNQRGALLGIYVADCAAVFMVDPVRHCLGLVHSGKKGTELAIASHAIEQMRVRFGSDPRNLIVQLSPCIRPPHYEVDFAHEIVRQVRVSGVVRVHDSGLCTACDLSRYYSYRAEKARTGRMLALLALG